MSIDNHVNRRYSNILLSRGKGLFSRAVSPLMAILT